MKQFSLLSRRAAALFLTPAGLLVCVFVLLPFFWVIVVSFTNRTLLGVTVLGYANQLVEIEAVAAVAP